MKKTLPILISFLLIIGTFSFVSASKIDKISICHFTNGGYEKIVLPNIENNDHFNLDGTHKAGHGDDILYEGEQACPVPPVPPVTGGGTGGGGGTCIPTYPPNTYLQVDTGVLNDNTVHLSWPSSTVSQVQIRYSETDGNWHYPVITTENDGAYTLGGLTNGVHYWFQYRYDTGCGIYSDSVDPLP